MESVASFSAKQYRDDKKLHVLLAAVSRSSCLFQGFSLISADRFSCYHQAPEHRRGPLPPSVYLTTNNSDSISRKISIWSESRAAYLR